MTALEEYRRHKTEVWDAERLIPEVAYQHIIKADAAIAELQAQLSISICIFCGTTMAKDPVVMLEHAEGCEQRPENRLLSEIDELKAEVERLKCCGNCTHMLVDYGEVVCAAGGVHLATHGRFDGSVAPFDPCHFEEPRWDAMRNDRR